MGDLDDVRISHAGKEIIQFGRGHHVRDHPTGQAELAASLGGGSGGEELVDGPFRDVVHEGRGYLGSVGGGGRVVDPLPDLFFQGDAANAFGADTRYVTGSCWCGCEIKCSFLETFLPGGWVQTAAVTIGLEILTENKHQ